MTTTRASVAEAKRLVVKLGSSTVASEAFGPLCDALARQVTEAGRHVLVVTSGAVALGMEAMGLGARPEGEGEVQALAALGQARLMSRYAERFAPHGLVPAQVLLTHEGLSHREHFRNVSRTLNAALELGLVPVVNENDTVATEELRFGDNDRLAAAVATVADADLVVLLSDVDALYDVDPRQDASAEAIHDVPAVDAHIRGLAGAAGTAVGTGGMASKVAAAELATTAGIPLIVASGAGAGPLERVLAGDVEGTLFHPTAKRLGARRHWIAHLAKVRGALHLDAGAAEALVRRGSSLLAIGVRRVEGRFAAGDIVELLDPSGAALARGVVAHDDAVMQRLRGLRTDEQSLELGVSPADVGPIVHRSDMVLVDQALGRDRG